MGFLSFLGDLKIKSESPLAFAIVSSVLFFGFLFFISVGSFLDILRWCDE